VLYGHQLKAISARVLRHAYGIQSWPEWDAQMHPESKKVNLGGVVRCPGILGSPRVPSQLADQPEHI
jgi:hypothetical protein